MLLRFAQGVRLRWLAAACAAVAAVVVSGMAVEPPAKPGDAKPADAKAGAAADDKEEEEDEETAGRRKFAEGVQAAPAWVKEVITTLQSGEGDKAKKLLADGLAKDPKQRFGRFLETVLKFRDAKVTEQEADADAKDPKAKEAAAKAAQSFVAVARAFQKDFPELHGEEKVMFMQGLFLELNQLAKADKIDDAAKVAEELFALDFDQLEVFDDEDFAKLKEHPKFKAALAAKIEEQKKVAAVEAKKLIKANESFAYDFKFATPDGKTYTMKDFAGKVVIVDVWATWCGPCKKEIPHFIELQKRYGDKGLAIVGINVEGDEPAASSKTIAAFVKENKITYPCLVGDDTATEKVPDFQGFPTTLFFDRTGKQRVKLVGARPLVELEAIVAELLSEQTSE